MVRLLDGAIGSANQEASPLKGDGMSGLLRAGWSPLLVLAGALALGPAWAQDGEPEPGQGDGAGEAASPFPVTADVRVLAPAMSDASRLADPNSAHGRLASQAIGWMQGVVGLLDEDSALVFDAAPVIDRHDDAIELRFPATSIYSDGLPAALMALDEFSLRITPQDNGTMAIRVRLPETVRLVDGPGRGLPAGFQETVAQITVSDGDVQVIWSPELAAPVRTLINAGPIFVADMSRRTPEAPFSLTGLHFNHELRPDGDRWQGEATLALAGLRVAGNFELVFRIGQLTAHLEAEAINRGLTRAATAALDLDITRSIFAEPDQAQVFDLLSHLSAGDLGRFALSTRIDDVSLAQDGEALMTLARGDAMIDADLSAILGEIDVLASIGPMTIGSDPTSAALSPFSLDLDAGFEQLAVVPALLAELGAMEMFPAPLRTTMGMALNQMPRVTLRPSRLTFAGEELLVDGTSDLILEGREGPPNVDLTVRLPDAPGTLSTLRTSGMPGIERVVVLLSDLIERAEPGGSELTFDLGVGPTGVLINGSPI
jgi:hypothetical protein